MLSVTSFRATVQRKPSDTFVHSEVANMVLLKRLLLILALYVVSLDASCPKGHKVYTDKNGRRCKPCGKDYYQPYENDLEDCIPCTPCDENSGSETKQECTEEKNTICQCREGFVKWDNDYSTCKCDIGSELSSHEPSSNKQCTKCKEGYFNAGTDGQCKKWKNCGSAGVKMNGTAISDVICNDDPRSDSGKALPSTSNQRLPPTTVASRRPHGGAQTLSTLAVLTTTGAPQQTTQKENVQPDHPKSAGNHNGWTFVIPGIAGLLLTLTAVVCILHIISRRQREKIRNSPTKVSTCRTPVEESGDGSELSLKQNPEEP